MKILKTLGVAIAVMLLNYLTYRLVVFFDLPLFLDTWATGLAILVGGLPAGVIGGALYNILLAILAGEALNAVWALCSIFTAFCVWFFYRNGWLNIKKPGLVILGGLVTGICNAILSSFIGIVFYEGLSTYQPTEFIYNFFLSILGTEVGATWLHQVSVEAADKIVTFLLIASMFYFLQAKFKREKTKKIGKKKK